MPRPKLPSWIVDESGCWIWQGHIDIGGYGDRGTRNGERKAHRSIYEQHHGPIPAGMHLHHCCGTPACVNPDHLEPLSPSDHKKLHLARRGKHAAKLDPLRVKEIRERVAAGESQSAVARAFGVTHVAVNYIVHRRTWADVP
jgi:hypothetical protein